MSNTDYLSAEEAAELLDIAPSTLAKWRRTGEPAIPYLQIGGRIRYRARDIEEFLENADMDSEDESEEADEFDSDE